MDSLAKQVADFVFKVVFDIFLNILIVMGREFLFYDDDTLRSLVSPQIGSPTHLLMEFTALIVGRGT